MISHVWVGEEDVGVLFNAENGYVHGYAHRDGADTYGAVVFVGLPRALWLRRHTEARITSLMSFPRCAVKLRSRESLGMAQLDIEQDIWVED